MRRLFAAALALWCAGPARAAAVSLPPSPAFVTISAAELRERYDTVWAVSDIHGRLDLLESEPPRPRLDCRVIHHARHATSKRLARSCEQELRSPAS